MNHIQKEKNAMKRNVSELTGFELDWAVGVALGKEVTIQGVGNKMVWIKTKYTFQPSTVWDDGGPIIERENIFLIAPYHTTEIWEAFTIEWGSDRSCYRATGPTPLIASMRCFAQSRLGDEVDIPDRLHHQ